ncbi:MAG: carboxymuconolactone decarboxylase family protein [Rhodospirillales bacterium]|nr:carboxymuconolactone decarboxylase family protein [Rhodospirillales bacterium]
MNHHQKGIETLADMLGAERAQAIEARFRALSPTFEQEAMSVVFGRTWSRDEIDRKTRALVSIGILSALGRGNALRIVFELAVANGASLAEITEVLLQVAIYAGYPAALDALAVLDEMPS